MAGAPIEVDVSPLASDAVTLDALARLQMAANRVGAELTFRRAPKALVELVAFAGLAGVLRVEPGRQAEEREERLGVEEEREPGDLPA